MRYDRVFRAKGLVDGCSTLIEMAVALERAAADLRQMNAQGASCWVKQTATAIGIGADHR